MKGLELTHDELAAAKDRKDWNALWAAAEHHAKQATLALMDEEPDDDTLQEAYEAAVEAIRDWDPLENAFSTHINMRVQQRVRNHLLQMQAGGIGSRWTVDEGIGAEHQTLAKPIGEAADEDDDPPTWLNNLTYGATGNVPCGYGDIGAELQDQHIDEEIAGYLVGLSPDDVAIIRLVIMDGMSEYEYAELAGIPRATAQSRLKRSLKNVIQNAKTCVMECRGVADWKGLRSHYPAAKRFRGFWNDVVSVTQNNPIWSEVTGKVYNDWAWRPDIMTEASFKRWSTGARRRKRAVAEAA